MSLTLSLTAMCDSGTHARVNVPTQSLWSQPEGLSQNYSVPEMATYGGPTW